MTVGKVTFANWMIVVDSTAHLDIYYVSTSLIDPARAVLRD
jgi:hypothetical protein